MADSLYEDTAPIQIFEELERKAIPEFISALTQCKLVKAPLFEFNMPDKMKLEDTVEIQPVQAESMTDLVPFLLRALKGHHRSESSPYPTRLVGFVQVGGAHDDVEEAKQKAIRINELKVQFGDALKELFPSMYKRQKFLRDHFQTLSARSVHRQLIIGGNNITKFSLHWTDKNTKGTFVEYDDVKDMVTKYCHSSDLSYCDAMRVIDERISHKERDQLVHFVDVRAHVLANLTYLDENNFKERSKHRPGLPLFVFGEQELANCNLDDYQSDFQSKMSNNKSKNDYHCIYSALGLYQRSLTDRELQKKRLNAAIPGDE